MSKEINELDAAFNAARECAWSHIPELATLTDKDFVYFVRAAEQQHPDLASLVIWVNAVRRELDFRLLLKSNPEIK